MGATLGGLGDHFNPGLTLKMPIGELADKVEKEFTIPLASGELGAWCHLAAQAGTAMKIALDESSTDEDMRAAIERVAKLPTSGDDLSLPERMLRSAYAEMVTAGVLAPFIDYAAATVFAWVLGGEEHARRFWESGGELGKAGNRATRRAQAREATRSTHTAEAAKIPGPGSTSGTTTRTTSRRSRRGQRSPGIAS